MQAAIGISILNRVAIGPLRVYHRAEARTAPLSALTPEAEWRRFSAARNQAMEQLDALYDKAVDEAGAEAAAILTIHQMMLEDEDYLDALRSVIEEQGATAEHAVAVLGGRFAATFAAMEDTYMKARAADVKDISRRLIDILTGHDDACVLNGRPVILAADDLTPSETVQLDKSRLLGFITRHGSPDSHTAILARTMGIPALIGVDFDDGWDGKLAVLDGCGNRVYINPTAELLAAMSRKRIPAPGREPLLRA